MGICPHNPGLAHSKRFYADGFRWIRADFGWHHIQPEPGSWNWEGMDHTIQANREAGLGVLGLIGYAPAWACQDKGQNYGSLVDEDAWRLFITKTAERYVDQIRYWEIWNEPNIPPFWRPLGDPEGYAKLLKIAFHAIKSVDPELQVVTGGTSRTDIQFIEGYVRSAGEPCFDIIAYHPYSFAPESQLREDVERIGQILEDHGYNRVPIWITEDASGQDLVPKNTVLALAAGVEKLFTYDDPYTGGSQKEMAPVFREVSNLLGKARYLGKAPNSKSHLLEDDEGLFFVSLDEELVLQRRLLQGGMEKALSYCVTPRRLPPRPHASSPSARLLRLFLTAPSAGPPLKWTVTARGPQKWAVSPAQRTLSLQPGQQEEIRFSVEAPKGVSPGTYTIRIESEARYCSEYGDDRRLNFLEETDALIEPKVKWTVQTEGEIHCSPLLSDLNGNGNLEVVFGSDDHLLRCVKWDGSLLWEKDLQDAVRATLCAADAHSTPGVECFALSTAGTLRCLSCSGDILRSWDLPGASQWGGVLAVQKLEEKWVVAAGTEDGSISCLDPRTGNISWKYLCPAKVDCPMASGDLDGEGWDEIVASVDSFGVVCLDMDGNLRWEHRESLGWHASPALADVDGDGLLEVLAASAEGRQGLHCLDGATGDEEWFAQTPAPVDAGTAVADLDGDGQVEILVCDLSGWVFCLSGKRTAKDDIFSLDGKGQEKWRFKMGAGADSSPTVADVNGKRGQEILIGSTDRYLYCLDPTGRLDWKLRTDMKISSSAAVGDLDADGQAEILLTSRDGKLYCLQASGKGKGDWTQKRQGPESSAMRMATDRTEDSP